MQDHTQLRVWQSSMQIAQDCYRITASFPKTERYALASQMRRAAVSVPSNIAEGTGRGSDREFARFLRIAYGSASELETQAVLANRLGYATETNLVTFIKSIESLRKMLNRMISKITE